MAQQYATCAHISDFFPGCYTSYCALCYGILFYVPSARASGGDADIIIYNCEYGFN